MFKSFRVGVSDFSELTLKKTGEKRVRFSVTFAVEVMNTGVVPLLTMQGWSIDKYRQVRTPGARAAFNEAQLSFNTAAPWFAQLIADRCESHPDVPRILGPIAEHPSVEAKREAARKKLAEMDITVMESK